MFVSRHLVRLTLVVATCLLLACSTIPGAKTGWKGNPPNVRVGPLLELLRVKTVRDKIALIPDAFGRMHVLIASTELETVFDVIVGPEGIQDRQVIRSDVNPWEISAAFDDVGRLHVLIDQEHRVLDDGVWRESHRTPWQDAGVKPSSARLIQGASGLIWSFQVGGNVLSTPGRWDWYVIGGGLGAIILPWHTHGDRTVIVQENTAGYGPWAVLDPQASDDTTPEEFATDGDGNLYVTYERSNLSLMVYNHQYFFAKIGAQTLGTNQGSMSRTLPGSEQPRMLHAITGQYIQSNPSLAVEKETGLALIGMQWIVEGSNWTALPDPIYCRLWRWCKVASAGNGVFQALDAGEDGVKFMTLTGKQWSAPLKLGAIGVAAFWGISATDMARLNNGNVFAAWTTEDGIVGRFIGMNR